VQKIDITDGVAMYWLSGDVITFEPAGERRELPQKGIKLLVVKNGPSTELYFSSLEFYYKQQLLNRSAAATFPFYLAYLANGRLVYDKSIPDAKLYDVSYERRQWYADDYLDPTVEHHIAPHFKRAVDFYGNSRLFTLMRLLAALALALFLYIVPFQLLRVFTRDGSNKLLFIGLVVYLVILFLLFRHSFYQNNDHRLMTIIDLGYIPDFTHAYMISEYIFYLTGYSSRVFINLLFLCVIIWNYEKIMSEYLVSTVSKIIKYILVVLPLVTPFVIAWTLNGRRDTTSLLYITMGMMLFARNRMLGGRKFMIFAVICMLLAIANRIDTIFLFIPVFLVKWLDRRTLKNTVFLGIAGVFLIGFALITNRGGHISTDSSKFSVFYMIDSSLVKHKDDLTGEEKELLASMIDGGIDTIYSNYSLYNTDLYTTTWFNNNFLSYSRKGDLRKLALRMIAKYPMEYLDKISYFKVPAVLTSAYLWNAHQSFNYWNNLTAELSHRHNAYKLGLDILNREHSRQLPYILLFSFICFFAMCVLFIKKLRTIGSISAGYIAYFLFMALYSPTAYNAYFVTFMFWLFFIGGIFIAEVVKNGTVRRSWVLPANIIIILAVIAVRHSFTTETRGIAWNESSSSWEQSTTILYPWYYRIFDKKIMLWSEGGGSRETMKYTLETESRDGKPLSREKGLITPVNRRVLDTVIVPGSAYRTQITLESADNDVWINVNPGINMRKHVYTILLFLFLYVNISFFKKKMFIVCVRWLSTYNNHAGIYYFLKKTAKLFPGFSQIIAVPEIKGIYGRHPEFYRFVNFLVTGYIRILVRPDDIVFLAEYFFNSSGMEQAYIAERLRGRAKIAALAHLAPREISERYSDNEIFKNISYADKLLVMGNDLRNFYIAKGAPPEKISVVLHGVDNAYYGVKYRKIKNDGPLVVLFCGNVQRNYDVLSEIIKGTPEIQYHICRGRNIYLDERFAECMNVSLHTQIEENELRRIMCESDVSLNPMNDVVGSNVIVSSLSCGLAMVCSDVGSIRDYVPENAGLLFKNTQEAVEALRCLDKDRFLLHTLQMESLKKSKEIDFPLFVGSLYDFLTS
jgi:glycosyltransferase involved in cell wall biosynthesis